jgi:predicted nucleic acid-binding protein
MTAVFLDTVGLLALWDRADQWHALAETAYKRIVAQRRTLVTTPFVLLECGNAAARRPYRAKAAQLRQTLERRNEVVMPSNEDWVRAWEAHERGDASQAGIVDHINYVSGHAPA